MQMHIGALKELGVDMSSEVKKAPKALKKKPVEDIL